jgi:hypothetical protein
LELRDRLYAARGCGRRASYVPGRCAPGDMYGCPAYLETIDGKKIAR